MEITTFDMSKLYEDMINNKCKYNFNNGILTFYQDDNGDSLKIANNYIAFSKDGFSTNDGSCTAISPEGIFAKYLTGQIILGEKLYIKSDDNLFYVGKVDDEFKEDDNGNNFGLKIQSEDSLAEIFLGLILDESNKKKPLFSLKGESGRVAIDEKGIVSTIQFCDRDLVDENCSMKTFYRVPKNVSELRNVMIHIHLDTFKCYSKGVKSGGSITKSISSTSSSGGGWAGTSEDGGGYSYVNTNTSESSSGWTQEDGLINMIDGFITTSQLKHYHNLQLAISIDPHSHVFKIPIHNHIINMDIVMPDHEHQQDIGCYNTGFLPTGVSVIVNGIVVKTGLSEDSDVDITSYLKKDYLNEIELKSESKGKFIINIYGEQFVRY